MWIRQFSKIYQNVSADDIWSLWSDIDNWHEWNPGIEYCKLNGAFAKGSNFTLKSKGGPEVTIDLIEVDRPKKFTDCTRFPGAKMYGMHEIEFVDEGIKLITTMKVEWWLSYLWIFLVVKKIVAKIPEQTDNLVALVRKNT